MPFLPGFNHRVVPLVWGDEFQARKFMARIKYLPTYRNRDPGPIGEV